MNRTSIEWCRTYGADGTFTKGYSVNPVRFRPHGSDQRVTMCQKVSAGCSHCYAEGITRRFWPKGASWPFPGYTAQGVSGQLGEFVLDEATLLSVLKCRKSGRVFWGDMTDLFGGWVKDEWLDRIFAVCALTPHLTHIFLTKRAERMRDYFATPRPNGMSTEDCFQTPWYVWRAANLWQSAMKRELLCPIGWENPGDEAKTFKGWPLPNVWLGVSAETQVEADERIPALLQTPAAVRFLSAEPLLGPMWLSRALTIAWQCSGCRSYFAGQYQTLCPVCGRKNYWTGSHAFNPPKGQVGSGLDWVIVGGESGPGARPMHPDWVRSLQEQCASAGVAFFMKQWGEWAPGEHVERTKGAMRTASWFDGKWDFSSENLSSSDGHVDDEPTLYRVGKKAAGNLLDGKEYHEFPAGTGGVAPANASREAL